MSGTNDIDQAILNVPNGGHGGRHGGGQGGRHEGGQGGRLLTDIYMLLTCIMVLSHVMCMEVYWSSAWIKWQLDF